jgi:asparagine synthase (glutamine-hydrolysing)
MAEFTLFVPLNRGPFSVVQSVEIGNQRPTNNDISLIKVIANNANNTIEHEGVFLIILGLPELNDLVQKKHQLLQGYLLKGASYLAQLTGHFCIVVVDEVKQAVYALTDKMGTTNLYYHKDKDGLYLSTGLGKLIAMADKKFELSAQSLYQYIYFHCIPSPDTIYQNVHKLEPARMLKIESSVMSNSSYWTPSFSHNNLNIDVKQKQQQLRDALSDATKAYANNDSVGTFLSGGLDSSSVTAYLAKNSSQPINTFTIGFSEPGYDEKEFAQAVSDKFATNHTTYDVTPQDIHEYLPQIASYYDEPFCNSSALPTFFCAKLAKDNGVDTLLAGDGGDELFAGNERYAKQKVFERYFKLPGAVRSLLDTVVPAAAKTIPVNIINKAQSYLQQANEGLPGRLQHYNFLHQTSPTQIFNQSILENVIQGRPVEQYQQRYDELSDTHFVDNMLYLDWKFTLADNDIMKVNYMTKMAGVEVKYPMLSEKLLALSCDIPAEVKLPGQLLRDFYKQSLAPVLPASTINKSKQGFGLPFGKWLVQNQDLQRLTSDALDSLKQRDIFEPSFIDKAQKMQADGHAQYYGELVWIMVMLELWLQSHSL